MHAKATPETREEADQNPVRDRYPSETQAAAGSPQDR
jgi:hypothetical protein